MVNAAMTAQLALSNFDVDGMVFSGVGGGADPSLVIGDVISRRQAGVERHFWFPADDGYLALVAEAAQTVQLSACGSSSSAACRTSQEATPARTSSMCFRALRRRIPLKS